MYELRIVGLEGVEIYLYGHSHDPCIGHSVQEICEQPRAEPSIGLQSGRREVNRKSKMVCICARYGGDAHSKYRAELLRGQLFNCAATNPVISLWGTLLKKNTIAKQKKMVVQQATIQSPPLVHSQTSQHSACPPVITQCVLVTFIFFYRYANNLFNPSKSPDAWFRLLKFHFPSPRRLPGKYINCFFFI